MLIFRTLPLLISVLVITFSMAESQIPLTERVKTEYGWLEGEVYNVAQDKRGVIWIASDNGLFYHDGFLARPIKGNPFLNIPVVEVSVDRFGDLWTTDLLRNVRRFGISGHLDFVLTLKESYIQQSVTKVFSESEGVDYVFVDNSIRTIEEDSTKILHQMSNKITHWISEYCVAQDSIFFATYNGEYRLARGDTPAVYEINKLPTHSIESPVLSIFNVRGEIYKYTYLDDAVHLNNKSVNQNSLNVLHPFPRSILLKNTKTLAWVSSKHAIITNLEVTKTKFNWQFPFEVNSVFQDLHGNFWITSKSNGIYLIKKDRLTDFKVVRNQLESEVVNLVLDENQMVYLDKRNRVWTRHLISSSTSKLLFTIPAKLNMNWQRIQLVGNRVIIYGDHRIGIFPIHQAEKFFEWVILSSGELNFNNRLIVESSLGFHLLFGAFKDLEICNDTLCIAEANAIYQYIMSDYELKKISKLKPKTLVLDKTSGNLYYTTLTELRRINKKGKDQFLVKLPLLPKKIRIEKELIYIKGVHQDVYSYHIASNSLVKVQDFGESSMSISNANRGWHGSETNRFDSWIIDRRSPSLGEKSEYAFSYRDLLVVFDKDFISYKRHFRQYPSGVQLRVNGDMKDVHHLQSNQDHFIIRLQDTTYAGGEYYLQNKQLNEIYVIKDGRADIEYPTYGERQYELTCGTGDRLGSFLVSRSVPYYRTVWFISFIVFLAVFVALFIFNRIESGRRNREKLRRQMAEDKLHNLNLQMNPHFLFNSINLLYSHLLNGNFQEAEDYILGFSSFLRTTIQLSKKQFVTLSQEVNHVAKYLELERQRKPDLFNYDIAKLPPAASSIQLPPGLLQPLIENAIIHGFANRKKDGIIRIYFTLDTDKISLIVQDNGSPAQTVTKRKATHSIKGTGTTTVNVKKRIKLAQHLSPYTFSFQRVITDDGCKCVLEIGGLTKLDL